MKASIEEICDAAEAVIFHYFCCGDGDGDGCGFLRRDMAKLALLVEFEADPGTELEIQKAANQPHWTEIDEAKHSLAEAMTRGAITLNDMKAFLSMRGAKAP